MVTIERLLHRRSDLSTFLVHLTREGVASARANLLTILQTRTLEAKSPQGMATNLDHYLIDGPGSQRVVCFTETPLEHTWMMIEEIEGRKIQFSSYGLVFTKTTARRKRCNPVWYLDITPGHNWLTTPINMLVQEALKAATDVATGKVDTTALSMQPVVQLTPFVEQMGTNVTRKEFWWEREWRHVRDFTFLSKHVVALLAPETDHEALYIDVEALGSPWAKRVPAILDPRWGQERMIAALAGIEEDQIGPFP